MRRSWRVGDVTKVDGHWELRGIGVVDAGGGHVLLWLCIWLDDSGAAKVDAMLAQETCYLLSVQGRHDIPRVVSEHLHDEARRMIRLSPLAFMAVL